MITHEFKIIGLPPKSNAHHMKIWTAKKQWTQMLFYQAKTNKCEPAMPNEFRWVDIMFYSPGPKRDKDNLHTLCKVPLDALKKAGLIHDDSPRFIDLKVDDQNSRPTQTVIRLSYDENAVGVA